MIIEIVMLRSLSTVDEKRGDGTEDKDARLMYFSKK